MVIYLINLLCDLNPIIQALIAGSFTFLITTLGSGVVFFFKDLNKYIMDSMLSISAGIMMSASFFSLLLPAMELSNKVYSTPWLILFIGFFTGGFLLYLGDKILDYFFIKKETTEKLSFKRCIMLFVSITLHNIPEGLVVGVAFSAAFNGLDNSSFISALTLTLGIAIQNFPEGSAISIPLRRDGLSRKKAFLFGALSGIVEPIFAIFGAFLVIKIQTLLPFIMSFTAGAMIFVICMELIPESQTGPKKGLMTLFLLLGFSIMMILELTLG